MEFWHVKKADKHEVMSYLKIRKVVEDYENLKGDFYDKSICLLKGLVKSHAFASGNRRIAMVSVVAFADLNKKKVFKSDNPSNSKVMIGIREDYYSDDEIKNWLKNGKINVFKRY